MFRIIKRSRCTEVHGGSLMPLNLPGASRLLQRERAGTQRILSNPANESFIQDNFRDSALNPFYWLTEVLGTGTVTQRDGTLKLFSGTTDLNYAMLKCKWGGAYSGGIGSTGYTLEISFRKTVTANGDADLFFGFARSADDPASLLSWEAFRNFDGDLTDLTPETDDSGATDTGTTITTFANGTWYRLMIVVDNVGDTAKFYVNNLLVDTLTELEDNFMGAIIYVRCRNAAGRAATIDINWIKLAINTPIINNSP